jgi:MoxR-like ATPase
MAAKWNAEDIQPGLEMETTFWPNPKPEVGFRFRATHLDGLRAPKVVLCDDPRIVPGVPCLVRIKAIRKPKRQDRGAIEVEFLKQQEFRLEGVYLDPLIAKQLQVLLESGLNILLDGPQGCGKTVLARSIAKTLGMEFVFFNCGAVIEATDFLATIQVRASATGSPVTDFLKTEVLLALEEAAANPGRKYLVFLDELNRCPENARNALMPALDATRRIFHPIENRFLAIPANVQFVAAVNRGSSFTGTFGIDAAQLDRFAPLQMGYPPVDEEVKLLRPRHHELSEKIIKLVVEVANRLRQTPELAGGLSVRATDEVCTYLKHPLIATQRKALFGAILRSSFCGRFNGHWNDNGTDAGMAWGIIQQMLKEKHVLSEG